ncbi:MAG: hypothetical protein HY365_02100 [Candidatus Aenigmarchaeota archaeon]|nr:hypothetical protein [Candidatus Aenigmarchaeota archaeon]
MVYLSPTNREARFWLKGCPRDNGDLYFDRDMYGPFVSCLQCGYYLTDNQMRVLMSLGTLREQPHAYSPQENGNRN